MADAGGGGAWGTSSPGAPSEGGGGWDAFHPAAIAAARWPDWSAWIMINGTPLDKDARMLAKMKTFCDAGAERFMFSEEFTDALGVAFDCTWCVFGNPLPNDDGSTECVLFGLDAKMLFDFDLKDGMDPLNLHRWTCLDVLKYLICQENQFIKRNALLLKEKRSHDLTKQVSAATVTVLPLCWICLEQPGIYQESEQDFVCLECGSTEYISLMLD